MDPRHTHIRWRRSCVWAVCTLATLLAASAALAADASASGAQARYQRERAACISGQSQQDQATCLKEANAALAEARRGRLDTARPAQLEHNALIRCQALPADDREACVARMHGQGHTSGSVAGGGIYREYTEEVLLPPQPAPDSGMVPGNVPAAAPQRGGVSTEPLPADR